MSVLLLIIPPVWLTVSLLAVLVCRAAARGDETLALELQEERRRAQLLGVVELEEMFALPPVVRRAQAPAERPSAAAERPAAVSAAPRG